MSILPTQGPCGKLSSNAHSIIIVFIAKLEKTDSTGWNRGALDINIDLGFLDFIR